MQNSVNSPNHVTIDLYPNNQDTNTTRNNSESTHRSFSISNCCSFALSGSLYLGLGSLLIGGALGIPLIIPGIMILAKENPSTDSLMIGLPMVVGGPACLALGIGVLKCFSGGGSSSASEISHDNIG